MFDSLAAVFAALPVATVSAVLFYASLVLIFCTPAGPRIKNAFFVTAPSSGKYFGAYDSLRGLLAAWVAVGHLCVWCGRRFDPLVQAYPVMLFAGAYAVPIFCSLSGMLIYRSLLKVQDVEGLRSYFIRRVLRIYPVYLVTTVAAMFFCSFPLHLDRILAELLMLRSFGYPGYINPPAWSLYVEALFYLVIPVLTFTCRKRMFLFSALAMVLLFFADQAGGKELSLWKFFFAGIFGSELLDRYRDRISVPAALGLVGLGFGLVIFAAYSNLHHGHYLLGWNERMLAACLAVPAIIVGLSALPPNPILDAPLLRIIGASSYSLYLLHPFVALADDRGFLFTGDGKDLEAWAPPLGANPHVVFWGVMLPAALFWAMASFLLIERPCLSLRRRLRKSSAPQQDSTRPPRVADGSAS